MLTVLTTGCPHSGWDNVLSTLQQAGLELDTDAFTNWHDQVFAHQPDGVGSIPAIQPDSRLNTLAEGVVAAEQNGNRLLSDSRALWMLDFWAEKLPEARFLLFYVPAADALAHAMANGQQPKAFMAQWQAANQQLMRFQRRHRHRSLLLNAPAAIAHPKAMIDACARVAITLSEAKTWPTLQDNHSSLTRFIASQYVSADPQSQRLQLELEASAYPLGEMLASSPSAAEAYHYYQSLIVTRDTLDTQLKQSKQVADNLQAELKDQENKANEAGQALQQVQQELGEENALLLQQLHQVQEELESNYLQQQEQRQQQAEQERKLQEATTSLATIQAERDNLHHELAALKQAKKQVENEQNKAEKTIASLQQERQSLTEENDLLLQQLHLVQEELEQQFIQNQQAEPPQHPADTPPEVAPEYRKAANTNWKTLPLMAFKPFGRQSKRARIRKHARIIRASGIFDEAWYLAQNPDVATAGMDPIEHYLRFGAEEGRNPSATFNTSYYLTAHPDVAAAGFNPLLHYIKFGREEQRKVLPAHR